MREERVLIMCMRASSNVADGTDVWPDNASIDRVLVLTLAAIGLVGYSTGQLLWRQRLHQRHHPHHHLAMFQYNTVEAWWT